jgi:hypothetical protein
MVYAAKLYRFKVDGQVIMKDHVPPEYAQMGYEVLNDQGFVVKHVLRAATAEELAAKEAKEAIKAARIERIRVRREADQGLLRIYSKPEDVERARKRKVDNINGYIGLQQRRITDLTEKLEKAQARAANYERSGQEIPVDMRLEIAQLQNQIRESHSNIKIRNTEKVESTKVYAEEYSRMLLLLKYPPGTLESDIPLDVLNGN